MMSVLVTGGAGYIGSHTVRALRAAGYQIVVVDNLSSGRREAVDPKIPFIESDVADREKILRVLLDHNVKAVLHFASFIQVGESVSDPRRYVTNNLSASIALLDCALDAGVKSFILSSTAAVYGNPIRVPIDEEHPTFPVNPYGDTKLAVERILSAYSHAYGLKYAALRYFNAAGADPLFGLGERHEPESHLIPLLLDVAIGRRKNITIFGKDHETSDGTCVRDYIHVLDLCDAHLVALRHLDNNHGGVFNVGTGLGHSVMEVIETVRRVTGKPITVEYGPRRDGDPPSLIASPLRAQKILGWTATRTSLDEIVRSAWEFHQSK